MINLKNFFSFIKKATLFPLCSLAFAGCMHIDDKQEIIEINDNDFVEETELPARNTIYFDFGKAQTHRKESLDVIKDFAEYLIKTPSVKVIVYGFVDANAPTREINHQCATKRTLFGAHKLMAAGVPADQIYIKSSTMQEEGLSDAECRKVVFTIATEKDARANAASLGNMRCRKPAKAAANSSAVVLKKKNKKAKTTVSASPTASPVAADSINKQLI
jgi:hypothetical protein